VTTTPSTTDNSAAAWLAAAVIVMPLLQALPIDFDRSGALVLLLPMLWAGRRELSRALAEIVAKTRLSWLILGAIAEAAVIVSVVCSDYPAPAAVTAAEWVVLASAGLIAGRVARDQPRAGDTLLKGMALSAAIGSAIVWLWWIAAGRTGMPLYAHHRHLGLHALAGAVATTGLALRANQRRGVRTLWIALGIVCWAGLLWSGGRGPVLALLIAHGAWFIAERAHRRTIATLAAVQLIGGLALSAAFWTPRPELGWWHAFERTAAAAEAGDVSALTSTRSEGWRESLHRAAARPWVGHGPDAYRFLTPKLDGQQPHNLVLQLWLDLGFIGGTALVALAFALVLRTWRLSHTASATGLGGVWLAALVALLVEGELDGVYYHLLAFLPAMVVAGVAMMAAVPSRPPRTSTGWMTNAATLVALAILMLHTFLFQALAVEAPPANPTSGITKLLRAFPSTTYGLWRWTDAWQATFPADALAWDRWAQQHGSNPVLFHVRAAQLLLDHGDRAGALAELTAAEGKAHWTVRPTLTKMKHDVETAPP
jgi:O-antigen ligase